MAGDLRDNLHAEIARLQREVDRLLLENARLTRVFETQRCDLQEVFGMSPIHAGIVSLLMCGRYFTEEQMLEACWPRGGGCSRTTVWVALTTIRKRYPWAIISKPGYKQPYRMAQESKDYALKMISDMTRL